MLTLSKLKIYSRYNGDGDQWLNTAWPWEKREIAISEWLTIQDLMDSGNGNSKKRMIKNTAFKELCDTDSTAEYLKKLLDAKIS